MEEQLQNLNDFQPGDKVRIRSGPRTGARGIICSQVDGLLEIEIGINDTVRVNVEEITNYSRAARRAWKAMPKRAGRPQLAVPRKKMVSMRLDVDVWEQLGRAVELGLISSREQALNTWLREHLDILFGEAPRM